MNGNYLLDTNIIIALFAEEQVVMTQIAQSNTVYTSTITVGELYYGAYNSGRVVANEMRIDEFALNIALLSVDTQTAKLYGKIKKELKQKGFPIPENDIWIASLAVQHGLTLVTRDKHFQNVVDLNMVQW